MSTCDPFKQIDDFLAKIKKIQRYGNWARDGFPGLGAGVAGAAAGLFSPSSLRNALECLVVGTADRSAGDLYPTGYNPYDLEAFKQQVGMIYETVALSAKESQARISGDLLHSSDSAMAVSGIWLSGSAANTFHGLVLARSKQLRSDASDMAPALALVASLADDLATAVGEIPAGVPSVSGDARTLEEQACPELVSIAGEFRKIGADVASSGDLGRSSCGATSLQDRLRALLAILPAQAHQAVSRALEIQRQLVDAVATVDRQLEAVQAGSAVIPAFDAQIEKSNHVSITETALYAQVAVQLEAICSDIQAYSAANRQGEMQQIVPRIHATATIALDVLNSSPDERINAVRTHPAALPYQMYVERLNLLSQVSKLTDQMDAVQAAISDAVLGANDRARQRISEFQDSIGAVEAFRESVATAADEYHEAVQGLVDELCVGILARLLAMTGYQEIEDKFLNGLFGDIPHLAQETATTIGQLVRCLQEFSAGACKTLPDNGPARFALDRLSDITRASERVQDFVSEVGSKIQGTRDSLTGTLDRLAVAIQKDVRAAIGAPPATVPSDSLVAAGGAAAPRTGKRAGFNCPADVTTDADGFMKMRNPVGLPPGVDVDPKTGYMVHDGVAPLPAGTYRDEHGFLKALPPVAVPSRAARLLPAGA